MSNEYVKCKSCNKIIGNLDNHPYRSIPIEQIPNISIKSLFLRLRVSKFFIKLICGLLPLTIGSMIAYALPSKFGSFIQNNIYQPKFLTESDANNLDIWFFGILNIAGIIIFSACAYMVGEYVYDKLLKIIK